MQFIEMFSLYGYIIVETRVAIPVSLPLTYLGNYVTNLHNASLRSSFAARKQRLLCPLIPPLHCSCSWGL